MSIIDKGKNKVKNAFKSKEEREMEARIAARRSERETRIAIERSVTELKEYEKKLEGRKQDFIRSAQQARKQGLNQQYQFAVNGLKMILSRQRQAQAMVQRVEMAATMRDLAKMSTDFVNTLGRVGKHMGNLVSTSDLAQSQMDFEQGMLRADDAMHQLEAFMEGVDSTMADINGELMSDDEMTREIERLIDETASVQPDPVDDEIDRRLAELQRKKDKIKE